MLWHLLAYRSLAAATRPPPGLLLETTWCCISFNSCTMLLALLRRLLPVHDISTDYGDPPEFLKGKQTHPQLVSIMLLQAAVHTAAAAACNHATAAPL
jgi:hypothetical protein